MSKHEIPEAAVEAAARAYVGPGDTAWDDLTPMVRRIRIQKMQKALEAAAPHMREVQWGVRDIVSLHIAGHPSEESAIAAVAAHPEWYEVVSRPMPGLWEASK